MGIGTGVATGVLPPLTLDEYSIPLANPWAGCTLVWLIALCSADSILVVNDPGCDNFEYINFIKLIYT